MTVLTIVLLFLSAALCIIASVTDLKYGIIYNKTLLVFIVIGSVCDVIYYLYFVSDTLTEFAVNFGIITVTGIALFFADCFAGGDTKLAIVLALLYPSVAYFNYDGNVFTLYFSIGLAVIYGYVYLLGTAIINLIKRKTGMSKEYIKSNIRGFVRAFITTTIYIGIINLICINIEFFNSTIGQLLIKLACIGIVIGINRYEIFQKWYTLISGFVVLVLLSLNQHVFPISRNIDNYIFVFTLMLCQMTIRTNIYTGVRIAELKHGMILTTFSSSLMQNSRVRGLPGISKEGLADRLTEQQVESIKRWASGNNISELTVVKKIPFAFFISLGYFSYFIIWCVLNAVKN